MATFSAELGSRYFYLNHLGMRAYPPRLRTILNAYSNYCLYTVTRDGRLMSRAMLPNSKPESCRASGEENEEE